jgi:predicted transcriptional regulator
LVTRRLIQGLKENPSLTLTVDTLQTWLSIPLAAAQRILRNLASSGLIREIQTGIWVPSPLMQPGT